MNRPEGHDVLRRWRGVVDSYDDPSRVLLGETWVLDLAALARFYGSGEDELHLALNVPFVFSTPGPEMRDVVDATEHTLPPAAWPLWNGSNHDAGRFASRWCDGDERRTRAALLILLTLRGTPLLYYGDEIGMRDVSIPQDRLKDPVGLRHWPENPGRDGGRTPMQWTREVGFTDAGVEPWLPAGDARARNVADQRGDPDSMLHLCRDLIALRRTRADLHAGANEAVDAPDGVWAWRRGTGTVVAVNHGDTTSELPLDDGEILIGTDRGRAGERIESALRLDPWEAVVLATGG
jgi:alpha-glucosidase